MQQDAERQTAHALHRASDILARESKAIAATDARETALLMTLQADPAAQRTAIARKIDGTEGYDLARARLLAAHQDMRLAQILKGHGDWVYSAAFSSDGTRVVTASEDGSARIWDAATGEALRTLEGHADWVDSAAFSSDGTRIVTASQDKTARIWEIPVILLADPKDQVRMACEKLLKAKTPLAFTKADAQRYPALQGEPVDPGTGDFVTPCNGVLPDEAFARAAPPN